jgi:hypothetical protein
LSFYPIRFIIKPHFIMTTPEVDSGEIILPERFKSVDSISGEGSYLLALDPNVRLKKIYRWAVFETVSGERPSWEEHLFNAIKSSKDFTYSVLDPESRTLSGDGVRWREEGGRFVVKGKTYVAKISRGLRRSQSIGSLTLSDELFTQGAAEGGGSLVLELEGKDPSIVLTNESLRWKGLIVVKGQPGEAILGVIGVLNQLIQEKQFPLWMQKEDLGETSEDLVKG